MKNKNGLTLETVKTQVRAHVCKKKKKKLSNSEKSSLILDMLNRNKQLVKSFEEKLNSAVDQSRVIELENTVMAQEKQITVLEYKSIDLEARSRRKNLIFRDISESIQENYKEKIMSFVSMQMDIHDAIVINRAHRLGRFKKDLNRPIIVAFRDYADTELIMSSARSIANTGYGVSRDYPLEITQARKALWPTDKDLRSKNGNTEVKLVFPAKIVVNGKVADDMFPNWDEYVNTSRVKPCVNTSPNTQFITRSANPQAIVEAESSKSSNEKASSTVTAPRPGGIQDQPVSPHASHANFCPWDTGTPQNDEDSR